MQENEKRTELNDLGEFGLISHLTDKIKSTIHLPKKGLVMMLLS